MRHCGRTSMLLVLTLTLAACQIPTQVRRELTAEEKAVKVAKGDQETSLRLHGSCKERGKVETFYHIDDAKIKARETGANTAQIIYAVNYGGSTSYDVRFWHCK